MRRSFSSVSAYCLLPTAYCSLCLLLTGCNVLGAIAYKTIGPTKVPAEYEPPKTPMLVLAESYGRANDLQPAADQLANLLVEELKAHNVAPMIEPAKLLSLRGDKAIGFDKMKIIDVGRALGARQILYVDLEKCDVANPAGSELFQGKIAAKVKIVDVETGLTKWPAVGDSHPMHAETSYIRRENRDTPLSVRNQMIEDLAGAMGRLFYSYQPDYDTGKGEPE